MPDYDQVALCSVERDEINSAGIILHFDADQPPVNVVAFVLCDDHFNSALNEGDDYFLYFCFCSFFFFSVGNRLLFLKETKKLGKLIHSTY